jgi:hypothetical protein
MNNYVIAAIGGILLALMVYSGALRFQVGNLRSEVVSLELALQAAEVNSVVLKGSISAQNEAIEAIVVELTTKETELEEWRNKPPVVRYNTIYKTIPSNVDIRRDDCETLRETINAIRTVNFNADI